nr:pentatricopeptide repeat-containing protein [Quercus suber]
MSGRTCLPIPSATGKGRAVPVGVQVCPVGLGVVIRDACGQCRDLEDLISLQLDVSKELSLMELLNCIFCPLWAGSKALQMYEEMRLECIQPTDVTLLSVLHACCHVGLVERDMELLESMAKDRGLSLRSEHYACVVDLLGWAELLTKAKHIIDGLPKNWQAFLGSCSIHGDSEMGIYAADQFFFSTAPKNLAPYILLSTIYFLLKGDGKREQGLLRE